MRLGLGCTALARGRLSGHLDGIGVYTSELLKYANSDTNGLELGLNNNVICTVFGKKFGAALPTACTLPMVYSVAAATSAATGLPFLGATNLERQIDLFHATDHYIPKLRNTVCAVLKMLCFEKQWVGLIKLLPFQIIRQQILQIGWALKRQKLPQYHWASVKIISSRFRKKTKITYLASTN
jgi:hypothetical protein